MNINDLLEITASICPDRKGFVYKNQSITFSELEHKVNELSDVLVNIGIKNGDRIFYFNTNSIDWVTIVFASSKIGAVVVPINYRSKSKELQFMLNDSEPALIFAGNRYHDLINNAISNSKSNPICINIEGELSDGWIDLENTTQNNKNEPDNNNNIALLVYTAGTTNTPKAVILNHSSFCEFALNNLNPPDPEFSEVNLLSVPLYHVAGIQTLISGIYSGRTTIIQDQFETKNWMDLVDQHKVNRVMLVPTMLKQIIDNSFMFHKGIVRRCL